MIPRAVPTPAHAPAVADAATTPTPGATSSAAIPLQSAVIPAPASPCEVDTGIRLVAGSTTVAYPLTLYYDASCPLCLAEMTAIKRNDAHDRIRLVDCSPPGFVDPDCAAAGIPTSALMWRLHARDADGRWWIGVPAFAIAYGALGVDSVAAFFADARLARPLRWLYGVVADHRQGLSRLGLNGWFGKWVGWMARRAQARAATCHDGVCERPDA